MIAPNGKIWVTDGDGAIFPAILIKFCWPFLAHARTVFGDEFYVNRNRVIARVDEPEDEKQSRAPTCSVPGCQRAGQCRHGRKLVHDLGRLAAADAVAASRAKKAEGRS